MTKDERWKHIEILSDLRAKYSALMAAKNHTIEHYQLELKL